MAEGGEAQIDGNRPKIVAFKAYLGYLHFGPEDPGYVPYYKLAEKYELPVIVHTGDNWSTTGRHPQRASPSGLPDQRKACVQGLKAKTLFPALRALLASTLSSRSTTV
jgi:predicted TIM-barrel fold metal-dependent hydrolase